MSNSPLSADGRMPALDGLRGFAALCVLVGHGFSIFTEQKVHEGVGQMAVALFFMLSAFLLTHIYTAQELSRATAWRYSVNRVARVLPLYWLLVPVHLIVFSADAPTFEVLKTGAVCVAAIKCPWAMWTIPVELQFYALFLCIWSGARRSRPILRLCAIGTGMLLAWWLLRDHEPARMLPMWAHFFLFGSAVAIVQMRAPTTAPTKHPYLDVALLAFFFLAVPGVRNALDLPGLAANADPLAIAATTLLFMAAVRGGALTGLFSARPARLFGNISYGVYLIHLPAMFLVQRHIAGGFGGLVIGVGVTIVIAALSFWLFETPVRRWISATGNRAQRRLPNIFT
ncbi:MAG: acyltransferase [Sphingomonadales bacterium]|nr:MAG: acyltransferase [Sphingomonadales bacterium]